MVEYRKKLIEVSLPLAAINAESAREKSIRHGHPSTLHLWWARRPLAACRAVLFGSLVDDPDSDPAYQRADGTVDEEAAGIKRAELFNLIEELVVWENSNNPDVIRSARAEIARCVASRKLELGELRADEELAPGITVKKLIRDCRCRPIFVGTEKNKKKSDKRRFHFGVSHLPPSDVVNTFLAAHAPPVLDPFAGGGSIPLEAQRLGLRAYASDLNPIPVLINKALIEIPPKFAGRAPINPESRGEGSESGRKKKAKTLIDEEWPGATGLAEDVRYYGKWMRTQAEKRIGQLYPMVDVTEEMARERPDLREYVGQKLTVIAWIWAKTVASANPAYRGVHVPLVRGFWLSKKAGKLAWVEPIVDRIEKSYRFTVRTGTPSADETKAIDCGTKLGRGCKFRCLLSDEPIPEAHVKAEGANGRLSTTLLSIVADSPDGRIYLPPDAAGLPTIPANANGGIDAPLANDPRNLWCLAYGIDTFDKLFTDRQRLALSTFSDLVADATVTIRTDLERANEQSRVEPKKRFESQVDEGDYATAISTYLGIAGSRCSNTHCTMAIWSTTRDQSINAFGRQAIPMTWDFPEVNPFAGAAGDFGQAVESMAEVIERLPASGFGTAQQLDATAAIADVEAPLISTDPPYYDNISYSDLSDFFYVWLRRSLTTLYPSLFATLVTPKQQELIASPYRHEGKEQSQKYFEEGLSKVFTRIRDAHNRDLPLTIYYGFKQAESDDDDEAGEVTTASTGWETMLEGIRTARFVLLGTWPIRTERDQGLKTGTNVLASSIVLVCRPRPENASLATRKEFLNALRRELPEALRDLQHGNIAPVDLAQSAIGPGMAVFTRYAKVLESDGTLMTVRTALGLINQTLDEVLAEQEGEFDADTRWALSWFEQFGTDEGPFGDAETLSKAKNTAINGLVEAGIIVAKSGKVRLIRRDELPSNWNPATDKRLTVWEVTQHLIYRLDQQGESGAAELVNQLGGIGEIARDLAYRLYSTCERKKWAQEALAYNSLVVAWPELTKLARSTRAPAAPAQSELF